MEMNVLTSSPEGQSPPPQPAPQGRSPSLTDDAFLGGKLQILQPEKGYRAGIDSVFLAATIPCETGETLFEAGLGTGVVSLCTIARVREIHVTGVEINARYSMIAEENAKRNDMEANVRVIKGDVKDAMRRDLAQWPAHGSFNHAFANPPFYDSDKATQSPNSLRAQANSFDPEDLELWVRILAAMVALRGTVTFVHRAESMGRLLTAMDGKFGDIRVAPLYAREGMAASRVIIQGIKGTKGPLQLLPGLVLHGSGSQFTPEAEAILRDGLAWRLR